MKSLYGSSQFAVDVGGSAFEFSINKSQVVAMLDHLAFDLAEGNAVVQGMTENANHTVDNYVQRTLTITYVRRK
jgi:hypothetical protein